MFFYYLCAVFTLISAAVSLGFSIDAYVKSKSHDGITLNNAKYAMARSLSLCLIVASSLVYISTPYLTALSVAMIGVQFLDGIIGIKISRFKTIGPFLTAIGNMILLIIMLANQ